MPLTCKLQWLSRLSMSLLLYPWYNLGLVLASNYRSSCRFFKINYDQLVGRFQITHLQQYLISISPASHFPGTFHLVSGSLVLSWGHLDEENADVSVSSSALYFDIFNLLVICMFPMDHEALVSMNFHIFYRRCQFLLACHFPHITSLASSKSNLLSTLL